jgi:hypothetical protein
MATIQQKRASELAKIKAAALKAGELAVLLSEDEKGKLFVGVDGQAGTAVAVRAGHADTAASADAATKLANAHNVSATGEVTAPAVAFDGTGDVALNVTINDGAITNDKLNADLKGAIAKAGTAVQAVTEGTTNGTISVDGKDVNVHGLKDAAYETVANLNKYADDAAKAVKDAVVNTLEAADNSVTVAGTATAKTVGVKLDPDATNAIKLGEAGLKVVIPAAAEYSIVKAVDSGDYAAVYNLTKDGEVVGTSINIPKDMVVKSGEVITNPDATHTGTFLVLTLANATEDKIYINVADLIEYVTSGSKTGDMVVIDVSADHKVTATITDGTVTKAKLAVDVQTSLGKADSAVQADDIAEGATDGTIAVKGADVAVHGLKDAAYVTVKSLNDYADNAATTAAGAVKGTDADANTAITVYGARALAQKGVNDAAAAKAEADKKVASVAAADKSIVVAGTATAPTVKVGISAANGNALTLGTDGLFVATPAEMKAGNGISIANHTVSAKVVAANGLSVDASGIKMAVASANVAGAVKGSTEIGVGSDGALSIGDIDCGEL